MLLDASHHLNAGVLQNGVERIYIGKTCPSTGQFFLGAPANVDVAVNKGVFAHNEVNLTTSSSNLFPLPSSSEFSGYTSYTNVYVREPSNPTLVLINAWMLPLKVDIKTYQLVIYPRLKIISFKLSPKKKMYHVGDRITATVKLNFVPPTTSYSWGVGLSIGTPNLNNSESNQGINFNTYKKTWDLNKRGEGSKVFSQTFTIPSWFEQSKPFSNRSSVSYGLEAKLFNERSPKMGDCYGISANDTKSINFIVKNNTLPSMVIPKLRVKRKPRR